MWGYFAFCDLLLMLLLLLIFILLELWFLFFNDTWAVYRSDTLVEVEVVVVGECGVDGDDVDTFVD